MTGVVRAGPVTRIAAAADEPDVAKFGFGRTNELRRRKKQIHADAIASVHFSEAIDETIATEQLDSSSEKV